MTDFIYLETGLAEPLGVPRETLAHCRQSLEEAKHWSLVNGRVAYTEEGITLILKQLGNDMPPLRARSPKEWSVKKLLKHVQMVPRSVSNVAAERWAAKWSPKPQHVRIVQVPINHKILVCEYMPGPLEPKSAKYHDGDGTIRVEVRNNSPYRPRMVILVHHKKGPIWWYPGRPPKSFRDQSFYRE